jgi:hypothetical protein
MPSQDETHAADPGSSGSRRLSRRSLLQGAATASAAGLAATAMAASPAQAATRPARAATRHPAPAGHKASHGDKLPSGAIVLNVRDVKSGDIEVFYGTSQVQLQDKELTARIARAIG